MSSKRQSTSAKIEAESEEGVLDFGKLQRLVADRRPARGREPDDVAGASKTDSVDSSSARHRAVPVVHAGRVSEEVKKLPPRACKITSWTTAGPNRRSEAREERTPKKSPKKTKSVEKGNSPLKIEIAPINKELNENPRYNGPPVFLVKRGPQKYQEDLSHQKVDEPARRRRRTKRERSPIFPPVSTKHLQPLCVIQKLPEPHSLLQELTKLLGSAISEIKSLQEALKEKEEADTIESVLARGLLATNNKPIFKKVLRWAMKNCRSEMIKKIEKKLGLKLKRKTRAQLENELPEDMPAIPKPFQPKKFTSKRPDDEDIDENQFPNLMVNRVLLGLTRNDSDPPREEKAQED